MLFFYFYDKLIMIIQKMVLKGEFMDNMLTNIILMAENQTAIPGEVRTALLSTFICLMAVAAIAMIVVVLMQNGNNQDLGAISGGNNNDTFFGKNKNRSKEGKLKIATIVIGALLVIFSIVYFIILIV